MTLTQPTPASLDQLKAALAALRDCNRAYAQTIRAFATVNTDYASGFMRSSFDSVYNKTRGFAISAVECEAALRNFLETFGDEIAADLEDQ